jgi:hypothetical protein
MLIGDRMVLFTSSNAQNGEEPGVFRPLCGGLKRILTTLEC